jgi:hypothetical protein
MLCDSTKSLLQSILRSLETGDETRWDDQTESGYACLYEMHQMTRPLYRAYKTTGSDKWPTHIPDSERMHRAMPHVKAMVRAIRRSDRATAVESGKAALAEMNSNGHSIPSAGHAKQATEDKETTIAVRRHPNSSAGKHRRTVAAGPKAARRLRVSSGK